MWRIYSITYCMHAHSFKAALIAFLVTSCLNWRHNYSIAYTKFLSLFDMKWYRLQRAPAPLCVYLKSTRYEHSIFYALVWLAPGAEATLEARLKCLPFDVVIKTFCIWINAILFKKKETRQQLWMGWPTTSPAPALTALNIFKALIWKK